MKYEIGGKRPHEVIEMFVSALALGGWLGSSYGVAEQQTDVSPWYIYVVFVLEEWGQRAVYRMNARGVFEKMTYSDRQVRLVVFR